MLFLSLFFLVNCLTMQGNGENEPFSHNTDDVTFTLEDAWIRFTSRTVFALAS